MNNGKWVTISGRRVFIREKNQLADLKKQYDDLLKDYYSSGDFYDFGTENKLEELSKKIQELEKNNGNNDYMNNKIRRNKNGKL